jgi:predicted phage baseplate assembly protein
MPLPDIQLDDRRFEELFKDAKRRIPRYTPEWTDLNDSDPGITLVQLFAWLAEMLLYRLNRVPEKNFVKFLELIGMQLNPPAPARADLTFKLSAKDLPTATLVPKGTQVGLAEATEDGPVIFETDDNLYAVGAELKELQSYDGAQFQRLTEDHRVDGKFFYALSQRPQATAAFYLGFDRAFPPGRHRLLVYIYTADIIEEGQGIAADTPDSPPPVQAHWEYWAGEGAKWQRLNVVRDETASLTRTGFIHFEAPEGFQATKLGLLQRDEDPQLYWLRYRIVEVLSQGYEIPPRLENVLLNTVTATNAVTVTDELLGASNGRPNQVFPLENRPVLPDTLILEVDEGEGFKPWTRVNDFAGSKRDDAHYTLDLATGKITFGDGEQGKIPLVLHPRPTGGPVSEAAADEELANIKATTYRSGGGARGNAGANTITSLQSSVPYVDSVTNHRPAAGGQDEETLAEAQLRAPQVIRSRSRAVTAADFEFLATTTPGARIRRAKALPLRHPQFEPMRPSDDGLASTAVPIPGAVTVIVIPESKAPKPVPTEATLTLVGHWLNQHRLITTELHVVAPRYRRVEIEARVFAAPNANSGEVAEALTKKLLNYFHPLHGGTDGTGWEFGGTVYFAETFRQILTTSGVARVEADAVTTYVDGQRMESCQDIILGSDELVYSENHTIRVSYT